MKANHAEAYQLALIKEAESNLARAYLDLMDVLTAVTHHDGALEEYKPRWLPILEVRAANLPAPSEASGETTLKDLLGRYGAHAILSDVALWLHDEWPKGNNAQLRPDLVPQMKDKAWEIKKISDSMLL